MEAQILTLDSKHFLLHRGAHPHGSDPLDPKHQFLLCDIEGGTLTPVTDELGTTAPAVSPDGRYFYHFLRWATSRDKWFFGRSHPRRRAVGVAGF